MRDERERSDRTRQPYAVLVFEAPSSGERASLWTESGARIRATDALGWLPDGRQCVLLRGSTVRDAVRLAEEILQALRPCRTACKVHGYPPFEYGPRAGWGAESPGSYVPDELPAVGLELRPGREVTSAVELMKRTRSVAR